MVGARLVEDSSIVVSGIWSSESSAFFFRELGPRTNARPETWSEKQEFISLPPLMGPQRNPHFLLQTRGWQGSCDKPLVSQYPCCPSPGEVEMETVWEGRGHVSNELAVMLRRQPKDSL